MPHYPILRNAVISVLLLISFVHWPVSLSAQTPEVIQGYAIESFYEGDPLEFPYELLCRPNGNLLIADIGSVNGDCSTSDGAVYELTSRGSISTLIQGEGLQEPIGLAVGTSGASQNHIYIGDMNSFSCNSSVFKLNSNNDLSTFSHGIAETANDLSRLAFGKGEGFGNDLYAANMSSSQAAGNGGTGGIYKINSSGTLTNFIFGAPLVDPLDLVFSVDSLFGTNLYVADINDWGGTGMIWKITSGGDISELAGGPPFVDPIKAVFGPGGRFSSDLFVRDLGAGCIFTLSADGQVSTFGTNFLSSGAARSLAFHPSEPWLFVNNGTEILRIFPVTKGDFTKDGDCDLLWRNPDAKNFELWIMNETSVEEVIHFRNRQTRNWNIVGVNDFSGDGKTDLLWHNSKTGEVEYWVMDGVDNTGKTFLPSLPAGWQICGTDDFNSDAINDLLLRNNATGENEVWLLSSTNTVSSVTLPAWDNHRWKIAGAADFNHDGNPDILWRNSVSGALTVWFMDETTLTSIESLPVAYPPSWTLSALADFDNDGYTDLVWTNNLSGKVKVWLMNGLARTSIVNLPNQSTSWKAVGPR